MKMKKDRYQPDRQVIDRFLGDIKRRIHERLDEKGDGIWVSSHEIMGVLEEEVREFKDAVHGNGNGLYTKRVEMTEELKDIAVAAVWGIISLDYSNHMDWV